MSPHPRPDVTAVLGRLTGGDKSAADQLLQHVYDELRRLAGRWFEGRRAQTLQPTALVHEAFLKVSQRTGARYQDRDHFAAICAMAMRGILADHARRRAARKRGGDRQRVELPQVADGGAEHPLDALALDEALTQLAERSERQARVVEYRFFGGMTVDEIAGVVGLSRSTVEADWRMARAWLMVHLEQHSEP